MFWQGENELPARILVREVELQHRLRFPADSFPSLHWLDRERSPIQAVAFLGPKGGILITQIDAALEDVINRLAESLKASPATVHDVTKPLVDVTRFLSTSWRITVTKESSRERFSFSLPEEIRLLGAVPNEKETAVLFATGSVLEVWPSKEWCNHIRKLGDTLQATIEGAMKDIDHR